jgi:hypothetical protein
MTAVVSMFLRDKGFVIGADGLRTDAKTGAIITDKARKIFSIEGDRVRLAYAWVGSSSILYGDGVEFSFIDESANIGSELATEKPVSIDEYVRKFALKMHKKLRAICLPDGRLCDHPETMPREEIAQVLIIGYYNGKPYQTGVRFSHKNLVLQSPYMDELIQSPEEQLSGSGSETVLEQFKPIPASETLDEAVRWIRKYIQACIDSRNKYDDCAEIGGHIHIAIITPEKFEWAIPPLKQLF